MNVYRTYPKGKNRIIYVARRPDAPVQMFLWRTGAKKSIVLTPVNGEPGIYRAEVRFTRTGKYLLTAYENDERTAVLIAEVV